MFESHSALEFTKGIRRYALAAFMGGLLLLTLSPAPANAAEASFFDTIKAFVGIETGPDEPDSNNFNVVPASQTVAPGSVNNFSWTFTGTNSAYRPIFTFTIPEDWTAPQNTEPSAPGYVTVDGGTCNAMLTSIVGNVITIRQGRRGCFNGQNFTINYFNATAPNPPTLPQTYTFTAYPSRRSPTVTVGFGATPTATGTSTATPTGTATGSPSGTPTGSPSGTPTGSPSGTPTGSPSGTATGTPTNTPTASPTGSPSGTPTGSPSGTPTGSPSGTPTGSPSGTPTGSPSGTPTGTPQCTPQTFTNSAPITIPNSGPGVPYPSSITVNELEGSITKLTVTLNGLTHTYPDDIDIMLVGPHGENAIIMSDAGGSFDVNNVTLTLDDAAAIPLPDSSQITTGTYQPANYGTGDTFPAPAPPPTGGSALSVFNGTDPEGVWSLYLVDDAAGDLGLLAGGWSITITTTEDHCGTPTATPTGSATGTPIGTPTGSPSGTPTGSPSGTPTGSPSGTATGTPTNTPTASPSGTPTGSPSGTATGTPTASPTGSATGTPTASPTGSATGTPTGTPSASPTGSATGTPTASATATPSSTPTPGETSVHWSRVRYQGDESQVEEVTIVREGDLSGTTTVSFSTADITATGGAACTSGVDYIDVANQTVTFAPGESTKSVFVTLCGDMIREPTERFSLILSGPNVTNPDIAVMNIHDTANQHRGGGAICLTPGSVGSSTIGVTNGPASIGNIRVSLYDIEGLVANDLDVLLVGPEGQNYVLMAGAGGATAFTDPVTLTFSDAAGQVLGNTDPAASDEYEATSYRSVANFQPPAPAGPYNLPGNTIGGTGTETLMGVFGLANSNGGWTLYVRNNGGSTGCIAGGWGLEFLSPTAGNVSISGQVTTAEGRGLRKAQIIVTGDSLREPRVARTQQFGYFSIQGLEAGQTYVVTVNSRNYTFSTPSQVVSPMGNLAQVNFQADPRH